MKTLVTITLAVLAAAATHAGGQLPDLSKHTIVDLSHAYGPSTVFWPTSPTSYENRSRRFAAT